ncbi:putative transcription factor WRKY family [Helianthus annuus]|nr:putative transcription factor WRKY family [Helianthus annuus]
MHACIYIERDTIVKAYKLTSGMQCRIADMERGVSRVENKYILKIKSSGNVLADDGYKWRKYGQKSIKNSANPR